MYIYIALCHESVTVLLVKGCWENIQKHITQFAIEVSHLSITQQHCCIVLGTILSSAVYIWGVQIWAQINL